ncbi:MAG: hypothetical protein EAZ92_05705 [Candidatus Kapaibacterium sp.]|nr:MAG: hypothetical protein EAZ92_05705 [Candidatus Kapabacteria bacterium]
MNTQNTRIPPSLKMLSEADIERLAAMKRRQRFVEYVGLISLQGFLAAGLLHATHETEALLAAPVSFGLAWMLTNSREERRTLDQHNTRRLLGDTIESFGLALSVAVFVITARYFGVKVSLMMTYLSVMTLLFFFGSFVSETVWFSRMFPHLAFENKLNYLKNLNRSIIFPYNVSYLRSILRSGKRNF